MLLMILLAGSACGPVDMNGVEVKIVDGGLHPVWIK